MRPLPIQFSDLPRLYSQQLSKNVMPPLHRVVDDLDGRGLILGIAQMVTAETPTRRFSPPSFQNREVEWQACAANAGSLLFSNKHHASENRIAYLFDDEPNTDPRFLAVPAKTRTSLAQRQAKRALVRAIIGRLIRGEPGDELFS